MIEWVLELSHIQPGLHHILHGPRSARMGLVAITMIVVGHVTEHFHHEHEHEAEREREQEDNIRIQALEDRIAELEGFQVDLEAKEKALEQEVEGLDLHADACTEHRGRGLAGGAGGLEGRRPLCRRLHRRRH